MNGRKLLAMVVLFCGPCCFAQAASNTANQVQTFLNPVFSITAVPPDGSIRLGTSINVTVTVTNISGKEIYWESERGKDSVYKAFVVLLKKDGREVGTTFFQRKISGRQRQDDPAEVDSGSSISLPHPPGKMFAMTIDLKRLYEITEPGLYTLDVSRFDDYSKTIVRSKTLTLKIVP
jgi:hypothetical protein